MRAIKSNKCSRPVSVYLRMHSMYEVRKHLNTLNGTIDCPTVHVNRLHWMLYM